jgi:hypothetical protein
MIDWMYPVIWVLGTLTLFGAMLFIGITICKTVAAVLKDLNDETDRAVNGPTPACNLKDMQVTKLPQHYVGIDEVAGINSMSMTVEQKLDQELRKTFNVGPRKISGTMDLGKTIITLPDGTLGTIQDLQRFGAKVEYDTETMGSPDGLHIESQMIQSAQHPAFGKIRSERRASGTWLVHKAPDGTVTEYSPKEVQAAHGDLIGMVMNARKEPDA